MDFLFSTFKNKSLVEIVKKVKKFEMVFAKLCGDKFLCVSQAMAEDVATKWHVKYLSIQHQWLFNFY